MTKKKFETEVSQLLHLIIHSLYSNKEIFLRELISNASDALDKRKHLQLTDASLREDTFEPKIEITFDEVARTLTVSDTGIGMSEADLQEQLGTIARSGTRTFLEALSGDQKKDSNLIGQFGVGFYSAYMVADYVEVTTRKAGEAQAWLWSSNGQGEYDLVEAERAEVGTTVELRLNEAGREFANRWGLQSVIRKYSNHISFPILLHYEDLRHEGEGDERKEIREAKSEQINEATALWKRPKKDISEEDYLAFYRSLSAMPDEPMLRIHTQAEGTLEYTTLFFVPQHAPADMHYATYRPGVKLYVKRVYITDDDKELLPPWLRFVRGVIDSEDLPLNVSREILQHNPVMERIRSSSIKKLLEEFEKLAEKDETAYAAFWDQYGRPLKEGLYTDYQHREKLLELVRFRSSSQDGLVSLAAYKERLAEDQKVVYYLTGDREQNLKASPLLEAYREKGIEVLLMDDEIDEIVIGAVGSYQDLQFKSINRADAADDLKNDEDRDAEKAIEPLVGRIKTVLGEAVKDVKASTRLSDSPSCLVVDAQDPTIQMKTILKSLGQTDLPDTKPILEINPKHPIVTKLQAIEDEALFGDVSRLLLEQAMLLEGLPMDDPAGFVKRLNSLVGRAL